MKYYDFTARSIANLRLTLCAFTALRTRVILETLSSCSKSSILFPDENLSFSEEAIVATNHTFWSRAVTYTFCRNRHGTIGPTDFFYSAQMTAKALVKKDPRSAGDTLEKFAQDDNKVTVQFMNDAQSMCGLVEGILPYFHLLLEAEEDTHNIAGITSTKLMYEKYTLFFWYVIAKSMLPEDTFVEILVSASKDALNAVSKIRNRPIREFERIELSGIASDVITKFYNACQPPRL